MDKTFTNYGEHPISFDVVVDDLFLNLSVLEDENNHRKALLSLANQFEDGKWMLGKFNNFIWNNIKETALNKEERTALIDEESSVLEQSAQNLRLISEDEYNEGGEIGEILLYGLMKKYYGALPVVPKIFYKQITKDYAKGADSVHIVLDKEVGYTLWLGESKFYNSLSNSRLDKIVTSIKELLNSAKIKKELSIVSSLKDLELHVEDGILLEKIKFDFKGGLNLDDIKKHLHVPILLLHECDDTANSNIINDDYREKLIVRHLDIAKRYMSKQDTQLREAIWAYQDICFHLILFPVPAKSKIVDEFFAKAKIHRVKDDGNI